MANNKNSRRTIADSFKAAFQGIWDCICSERNMRIHFSFMAYILFFAVVLHLDPTEYAVLFLTMALVLSTEMMNTAIEKQCDFIQTKLHPQIRMIKDIAAGAVLVAAIFAVSVGVALLWRPAFWQLLLRIITTPTQLALLLLSLILALMFIFWGPMKMGFGKKK